MKSAVAADLESRLQAQADRIESTYQHQLSISSLTLAHTRSHFESKLPTREALQKYVESINLQSRDAGSTGIGYLEINAKSPLASHVTTIEPPGWLNRSLISTDVLSDESTRLALIEAARTGDVSLARLPTSRKPMKPASVGKDDRAYFGLFLPVYHPERKNSQRLKTAEGSETALSAVRGFFFSPFESKDFFESSFGAPSLQNEKVNFEVRVYPTLHSALGNNPGSSLYNRFNVNMSALGHQAVAKRTNDIGGSRIELTVRPLATFYTLSDRYLATTVGFGAAFISILILLALKASQDQILYETKAKELSVEAAQRSRSQTRLLERLNDAARGFSFELGIQNLLAKFFDAVVALTGSDGAFLYFLDSNDVTVSVQRKTAVADLTLKPSIPISTISLALTNRLIVRKGDAAAPAILSLFTEAELDENISWRVIVIPAPDGHIYGALFLSRNFRKDFEQAEIEIAQSLVAHAASAIQNAKLFRQVEEASRAKNAFLANLSHEIRTPLNAIIGFSELILRPELDEAERRQMAASLARSGEQLTELIDDILDLSKIEAGKLQITRKKTSITAALEEIKSMMHARAKAKNLLFSIESSGPLPAEIETDSLRLKQILLNLIGNAIKFTESGSVVLYLRVVHPDTAPPGDGSANQLVIRVRDSGIGISEDAKKQLFMPFSQADSSATRRFGGSGLGLALSKRLAKELGGDLQLIDSILGQGSTFEARIDAGDLQNTEWIDLYTNAPLTVPIKAKPTLTITAPSRKTSPRLEGKKILLVEDSVDNQQIFRFFLESSGAKVEIAETGLEAVRIAATCSHDLILMDIQIPEIDGKEATRRIRNQGYVRPIVALTAHAMTEERRSCIEAGCDGQITKPVSGENLVHEVAEYMRRNHGSAAVHT